MQPINGPDTGGVRIIREILVDTTKNCGCAVLISSHILGELEMSWKKFMSPSQRVDPE